MADPKDAEVIDLTARLREKAANATIDPGKDQVVKLAMDLLKVIREEADDHPMNVLTAMQVANNTVGLMYLKAFGREEYMKMATTASIASRMYEANCTRDTNGK